jgi:hypothetical protein
MRGAISPLLQYAFMAWCSIKKSTGTTLPFTFMYTSIYFLIFEITVLSLYHVREIKKNLNDRLEQG